MKKFVFVIVVISCLFVNVNVQAQQNSTLRALVDTIKRDWFPIAYNNVIHYENTKYGLITNQPLITIDNKIVFANLNSYYILDQYDLNQIAGIDVWENDSRTAAIFGNANGVIHIYTRQYIDQHPNIRNYFDYSLENGQIIERKKKSVK
jgi:hypothetical protein